MDDICGGYKSDRIHRITSKSKLVLNLAGFRLTNQSYARVRMLESTTN